MIVVTIALVIVDDGVGVVIVFVLLVQKIDLRAYHRAKTGALFVAATQMGAIAAGQDGAQWDELGSRIGEAFQVADDLRDALYNEAELGNPAGQDDLHGRPNAVAEYGI